MSHCGYLVQKVPPSACGIGLFYDVGKGWQAMAGFTVHKNYKYLALQLCGLLEKHMLREGLSSLAARDHRITPSSASAELFHHDRDEIQPIAERYPMVASVLGQELISAQPQHYQPWSAPKR
eukprot:977020-Amphidinium_carterae.1